MERVALGLALILLSAKLGGDGVRRLGLPAVLGELLAGVVLGNLARIGLPWFEPLKTNPSIEMLAQLGILILLFEVGLESTVKQMLSVGLSSLMVAALGVLAPFALGWIVSAWLLPEQGTYVHVFIAATLCATSVGVTARLLKDMNRAHTPEALIILGAAVIDDVLGLIILAIVTNLILSEDAGRAFSVPELWLILGKASAFLVGAWVVASLQRLQYSEPVLVVGLSWCFGLSGVSAALGLAPMVGAFTAGLILDGRSLRPQIEPISGFLVPIFFVRMGMQTDLQTFANPFVLLLSAALIVAAALGKQACALGVYRQRSLDRLSIGIGMMPRGEVGLIFASVGRSLHIAGKPVVNSAIFSAIVVMVMVTTLLTPPALKWRLSKTP